MANKTTDPQLQAIDVELDELRAVTNVLDNRLRTEPEPSALVAARLLLELNETNNRLRDLLSRMEP